MQRPRAGQRARDPPTPKLALGSIPETLRVHWPGNPPTPATLEVSGPRLPALSPTLAALWSRPGHALVMPSFPQRRVVRLINQKCFLGEAPDLHKTAQSCPPRSRGVPTWREETGVAVTSPRAVSPKVWRLQGPGEQGRWRALGRLPGLAGQGNLLQVPPRKWSSTWGPGRGLEAPHPEAPHPEVPGQGQLLGRGQLKPAGRRLGWPPLLPLLPERTPLRALAHAQGRGQWQESWVPAQPVSRARAAMAS